MSVAGTECRDSLDWALIGHEAVWKTPLAIEQ